MGVLCYLGAILVAVPIGLIVLGWRRQMSRDAYGRRGRR